MSDSFDNRGHRSEPPPYQQFTQRATNRPVRVYRDEQYRDSDEDSNPYSDSDEDTVQNPDEQYNSSYEDSSRYSERDPHSDSEDMEEDSDGHPVNYTTMPDAIQRPSEHSRLRPHQVSYDHQAQDNYPAAGPASGNGMFKSPGYTSWGHRQGQSQLYATSQMEGSRDSALGVPALHDPMQETYTFVDRPVTQFERPASETVSHFSPQQEWEVRHEVASENEPVFHQGPWSAGEVEKLEEFKKHNPNGWAGVEEAIVGRTKGSAQQKWKYLQKKPYNTSAHPTTGPDHATSHPSRTVGLWVKVTPEQFEQIKVWNARGHTYGWIGANCDPPRTINAIQKTLDRKRYDKWTTEQDNHLITLKIENHGNLAEIMRKYSGPGRSEEEISARLQFLEGGRPYEQKPRERRLNTQYLDASSRDEEYARLQLEEGVVNSQRVGNVGDMGSSVSRGLRRRSAPRGVRRMTRS